LLLKEKEGEGEKISLRGKICEKDIYRKDRRQGRRRYRQKNLTRECELGKSKSRKKNRMAKKFKFSSKRNNGRKTNNSRDGIFHQIKSPGIDSNESIPPTYVAWRAGTTTLFHHGS